MSVNQYSFANEKLIYNEQINGAFQWKFRKQGGREFNTDMSHLTHSQFKELFEKLLLGLLKKAKLSDSWYIEYKIKDETGLRYQVLSPMNEHKLKDYINISLVQEPEI
jgi:hypothetical protein